MTTQRKKRLRIIQISLLFFGVLVLIVTYGGSNKNFEGKIIHPQFWSSDINYLDKKIAVIGSGATAITIVPALSEKAKHVVMIQRSPSYVISMPSVDRINKFLRKILPKKLTYFLVRWKNIIWQSYTFFIARTFPNRIKNSILQRLEDELGSDYDVKKHFTPSYKPWDQRMCLVPDSDLFKAIKENKVSIATDTIKEFKSNGILLNSGKEISADIIITATVLNLIHLMI